VRRLTAVFAIAAFSIGAFVGCGNNEQTARPRKIEPLQMNLPGELLGLKVKPEDISGPLATVKPSYVRQAALFSMRTGDDLVQATLQVSRFTDESRYKSNSFRRTIITQLGSTPPRETRMGKRIVWRTSGSKAALAIWFDGNLMFLLSIRDDFAQPRTLIRTLLNREAAP
jgi:hypothetical protein